MASPAALHPVRSSLGPARPRRRSRAKPKPARARLIVTAELRGLGGVVLEQALLDSTSDPQKSLIGWANRLAAELDVEGVGMPRSYRDLMQGIVAVNRRAAADPSRPLVALPPLPAM
jgi:hypothetical protein